MAVILKQKSDIWRWQSMPSTSKPPNDACNPFARNPGKQSCPLKSTAIFQTQLSCKLPASYSESSLLRAFQNTLLNCIFTKHLLLCALKRVPNSLIQAWDLHPRFRKKLSSQIMTGPFYSNTSLLSWCLCSHYSLSPRCPPPHVVAWLKMTT